MTITAISVLRRDPALSNATGLIAGSTGLPGAAGAAGADGRPGLMGSDGAPGRGVQAVAVDSNGHFIVTYTDGSTSDAGAIPSTTGADGGVF